jgi:hypothetical protein
MLLSGIEAWYLTRSCVTLLQPYIIISISLVVVICVPGVVALSIEDVSLPWVSSSVQQTSGSEAEVGTIR